jgi:hypothetical protein
MSGMPCDGATLFSDLIGKLDVLRVVCSKCERGGGYGLAARKDVVRWRHNGQYSLAHKIEEYE